MLVVEGYLNVVMIGQAVLNEKIISVRNFVRE